MTKPPRRKRERVTAAQYEQALMDTVEHARQINVSRNAISQSMSFGLMLAVKLFGLRKPESRTQAFNDLVARVVEDAKVERAEADLKERQAVANKPRILLG